MLPWEHPPRKPIGRPEEVAAGEGVHVRGWGADLQREGGGLRHKGNFYNYRGAINVWKAGRNVAEWRREVG